eukprot:515484-Alexandrium_andersonii.AAC.1
MAAKATAKGKAAAKAKGAKKNPSSQTSTPASIGAIVNGPSWRRQPSAFSSPPPPAHLGRATST